MDSNQEGISVCISEYEEARDRFQQFSEARSPIDSNNDMKQIFSKLITGKLNLEPEFTWKDFYDILHHADYLLIKKEFIETIYSELCRIFVLSDLIKEITENLVQLENISHIKEHLVRGFLKILQVTPKYENDFLVLKYSPKSAWSNIEFNDSKSVKINPCAFKIMHMKDNFNLAHINFLLHLLGVQKVVFDGCNLNGRNIEDLLVGLKLQFLGISKCGTSVNKIFDYEMEGALKNLTHLDISENPLYESTLSKIKQLPLKHLNIKKCIKTKGKFVNSIWFSQQFSTQSQEHECRVNMDLLWENGTLKENIKVLDINENGVSQHNMEKILQLKLEELWIGNLRNISFPKIVFPNTLKTLIVKNYVFSFNGFQKLCEATLEKLDFEYEEDKHSEFSHLKSSPLFENLKELSVNFHASCEKFIEFISNIELIHFKCDGEIENESLDKFISEPKRKHLKSLFISGPLLGVTSKLLEGMSGLKLNKFGTSTDMNTNFLRLKNFQESIFDLTLCEYHLSDDDLGLIAKFEKLEKLSFSFIAGASAECLSKIANMKTLKHLKVEGMVSGELNLKGVLSLCAIPIHKLCIYDDYGRGITEDAFKYLSEEKNAVKFCQNSSILEMRASITPEVATALSSCTWESISFISCVDDHDASEIIFQSESLKYTLQYLMYMDLDLNWKLVGKLFLSEIIIEEYNISEEIRQILSEEPISKFLRYILLEDSSIPGNFLLQTSVSEVDTY